MRQRQIGYEGDSKECGQAFSSSCSFVSPCLVVCVTNRVTLLAFNVPTQYRCTLYRYMRLRRRGSLLPIILRKHLMSLTDDDVGLTTELPEPLRAGSELVRDPAPHCGRHCRLRGDHACRAAPRYRW